MPDDPWPDVIEVVGPRDVVAGLSDIDGLLLDDHGQRLLDDEQLKVTAYATEAAADAVRERGCTVSLVISGADLQDLAKEDASTREDEDGGVV